MAKNKTSEPMFTRSEIANIPSLSKFFSNFLVVFKTRYRRNYYKLYLAILQNPILHMNFTFKWTFNYFHYFRWMIYFVKKKLSLILENTKHLLALMWSKVISNYFLLLNLFHHFHSRILIIHLKPIFKQNLGFSFTHF